MTSLVKHTQDSQEEMDRIFQAKRHIIFPFFVTCKLGRGLCEEKSSLKRAHGCMFMIFK